MARIATRCFVCGNTFTRTEHGPTVCRTCDKALTAARRATERAIEQIDRTLNVINYGGRRDQ